METSPFICGANKWTAFYMITTSVMKELMSMQNNKSSEKDVLRK